MPQLIWFDIISPMVEQNSNSAYLEPQAQLALAARVNRLCEISSAEFNEGNEDSLVDAHEVVKLLDPRIELSDKTIVEIGRGPKKKKTTIKGSTLHGEVSISQEGVENDPGMKFGKVNEYRIGGYVATRRERRKRKYLTFETFFGRGEVNEALEKDEAEIVIFYNDNLEIQEIARFYPIKRTYLKILELITYARDTIWRKDRIFKH